MESSTGCVMVAGTLVKLEAIDGRPADAGAGSIIVSRGWVALGARRMARSRSPAKEFSPGRCRTSCWSTPPLRCPTSGARTRRSRSAAGGRVWRTWGRTCSGPRHRLKSIQVPDLPLGSTADTSLGREAQGARRHARGSAAGAARSASPAAAAFIFCLNPGGLQPTAVIFQFEGRRYFADLGQPIVDEAGAPVAALRGWKLMSLANKLAILSGPEGVTVLRMNGNDLNY